jgi:predicted RNase H-like nuclease (RuvC/YqgF family)
MRKPAVSRNDAEVRALKAKLDAEVRAMKSKLHRQLTRAEEMIDVALTHKREWQHRIDQLDQLERADKVFDYTGGPLERVIIN